MPKKKPKTPEDEFLDDPLPLDEDDPEVREEMFEDWMLSDVAPEQIKEPDLHRDYVAYLKNHKA